MLILGVQWQIRRCLLICRILDGNAFNGTLDLGRSISSELSIVSFKDNDFSSVTLTSSYNGTLA